MKVIITEYSSGANITLEPENQPEANQLLRLAANCKPTDVDFMASFSSDKVLTNIHFVSFKDRRTSIRNHRRK